MTWIVSGNTPETAPSRLDNFLDARLTALGFLNNLAEDWDSDGFPDDHPEFDAVLMAGEQLDLFCSPDLTEGDHFWELTTPEGDEWTLRIEQVSDTCEFPECRAEATRRGLLQVANPSAEHPEGVQKRVSVCEHHSFRWSALWGSWPLPEAKPMVVALTGRAATVVERTARELNVTAAEAMLLILDQIDQMSEVGSIIGDPADDNTDLAQGILTTLDRSSVRLV